VTPPQRRLGVLLCLPVALLAGCASVPDNTAATASPSASASASPSAEPSPSASPTVAAATDPVRDTPFGVKVTGKFGDKPQLTVPAGEAPAKLVTQVLDEGSGPVIAKGQLLVVNYLGQTWKPAAGKVNIFDNSYDRKAPASFPIGEGQVIPGWDATLVGQKTGSRVVMSIPPAQAYGAKKDPAKELSGEALIFVVDILGGLDKNATANGTPGAALPAGFPKIESVSGQVPKISSVAGVKPGTAPQSALLLKGSGDKIDAKKQLAIQVIQTDSATGKQTQQTWGQGGPQLVAAEQVLSVANVLKDGNVGSRVVAVAPGQGGAAGAGIVLVIDVIGQY
jgi:peptidylprolyl isomerase